MCAQPRGEFRLLRHAFSSKAVELEDLPPGRTFQYSSSTTEKTDVEKYAGAVGDRLALFVRLNSNTWVIEKWDVERGELLVRKLRSQKA